MVVQPPQRRKGATGPPPTEERGWPRVAVKEKRVDGRVATPNRIKVATQTSQQRIGVVTQEGVAMRPPLIFIFLIF